ncbi:hypothetical protein WA026_007370 [Henosepilachna vigintioctopunctata]|uniref:Uncharacterized protein n=1 Tax=Henosepilachna vigintioctopunctata TaxID=420089 RepID=A0AAW1UNZ6_9CUCU
MVDFLGTFNKISSYVSSVASKLGAIGGQVWTCITSVDWTDLWSAPKNSLVQTWNKLIEEIKKLWHTIWGWIVGTPSQEEKKDETSTNRRRRHVLED